MADIILPPGWAKPVGYANAVVATGRQVYVAGQVGWDPRTATFDSDDFAAQTRQALANVVTVLRAAGAEPHHIVRLTWFVTSRADYMAARHAVGVAYRETLGDHYPAMSLVVVSGLLEERARVEIEATAVVPDREA